MKSSKKLVIHFSDVAQKELILAWTVIQNPESIVEEVDYLEVYTKDQDYAALKSLLIDKAGVPADKLVVESVEHKNWNAEWEANFKPLAIDNIYIRAPFHPASSDHEIDLIISPKMAFGTGHHETTYMMLKYMNALDFEGKKVLDYGCGTGILTVFAKMKGCDSITGIDIQEEAVENTYEHFELNNISTTDLTVSLGDLDVLSQARYDIILANINRHVLLANADKQLSLLQPEGLLIMSGILQTDRQLILDTYTAAGFSLKDEDSRGDWCRFGFVV